MSLIPVSAGFALASGFWFLMFSPLTTGLINFWLTMTVATGTLGAIALASDRRELGVLYSFKRRWIVIGLISAGLLYLFFVLGDRLSALIFDFSRHQISGIYSTRSQASPAVIGSLLLLWIGPGEEIFWRGFAQRRLSAKYGALKGFLITALVYAGVHIWALNFMLFMASLICGLFWGLMYLRYRSVWPGLISHGVWDLAIFVLFPIQ